MKILITGTPGTGKSTISKKLSKILGLKVINEKKFSIDNKIGFNTKGELELPLHELEACANLFLKNNNNIIFEGHVFCETKLNVDLVIVLQTNFFELKKRLSKRNYSIDKLLDNLFCEETNYCLKKTKKNYSKNKIIIIDSSESLSKTIPIILTKLNKK